MKCKVLLTLSVLCLPLLAICQDDYSKILKDDTFTVSAETLGEHYYGGCDINDQNGKKRFRFDIIIRPSDMARDRENKIVFKNLSIETELVDWRQGYNDNQKYNDELELSSPSELHQLFSEDIDVEDDIFQNGCSLLLR